MDAQIGCLKAQKAVEGLGQRPLISITLMRSMIRIRYALQDTSGPDLKKKRDSHSLYNDADPQLCIQ
jgi:hypothetical protein